MGKIPALAYFMACISRWWVSVVRLAGKIGFSFQQCWENNSSTEETGKKICSTKEKKRKCVVCDRQPTHWFETIFALHARLGRRDVTAAAAIKFAVASVCDRFIREIMARGRKAEIIRGDRIMLVEWKPSNRRAANWIIGAQEHFGKLMKFNVPWMLWRFPWNVDSTNFRPLLISCLTALKFDYIQISFAISVLSGFICLRLETLSGQMCFVNCALNIWMGKTRRPVGCR
jgi:hypothetical protein